MTAILPRSRVGVLLAATGVRVVRVGGLDDCDSGSGGRGLLTSSQRQAQRRQGECRNESAVAHDRVVSSWMAVLLHNGSKDFAWRPPQQRCRARSLMLCPMTRADAGYCWGETA